MAKTKTRGLGMVEWISEQCPVCRRMYQYPKGGYKPKTCNNFDCTWGYLHHPEKYKPISELLDKYRKEAGI